MDLKEFHELTMNSIFFPIMICFLCFPSIFLANVALRRTVDAMHDAMHQLSGNPRLYINIGKWKIWHQQCPKKQFRELLPPKCWFWLSPAVKAKKKCNVFRSRQTPTSFKWISKSSANTNDRNKEHDFEATAWINYFLHPLRESAASSSRRPGPY